MAGHAEYKARSKVWVYPGTATWRFINVDKKLSAELKEKYGKKAKGFGSIKVRATIGKTSWNTSIFPDKQSGTYLLPLKAAIRKAEGIMDKDAVTFRLTIV